MAGGENLLLCAARAGKGRLRQGRVLWSEEGRVRGSAVFRECSKVKKTNISAEFPVRVLHCDDVWRAPCQASGAASFVSSSSALPQDYNQPDCICTVHVVRSLNC